MGHVLMRTKVGAAPRIEPSFRREQFDRPRMSEAKRARVGVHVLLMTLALCGACGGSPLSRKPDGGTAGHGSNGSNDASEDRAQGAAGDAPAPDGGGGATGGTAGGGAAGTGTGGAAGSGSAGANDGGAPDSGAADAADAHLTSHVDGGVCVKGFAHCTTNPQDKCETSIETADNCGACGAKCTGAAPVCVLTSNGVAYRCVAECPAGFTHCGKACVDLQTTSTHCGSCDVSCLDDSNVLPTCKAGVCQKDTCYGGFATCGAATPACTTRLDSTQNCGACGNAACNVAHTLLTCSGGAACDHPVCAAGFANCDTTSPDCETAQGAAGACFPIYRGTLIYTGGLNVASVALGADGSTYFAGALHDVTDLDPGPAKDLRGPLGMNDAVISKVTADGKEAWALKLGNGPSNTQASALALGATSITVVGVLTGNVDFDPGVGTALGAPVAGTTFSSFVASYPLDGKFNWVRTLTGKDTCLASQVAVDATGSIYVAGGVEGTCSFDGAGGSIASTTGGMGDGFLAKLGADGKVLWSRVVAGDTCQANFTQLVTSADGSVWVSGQKSGACSVAGTAIPDGLGFVASFTPAGDPRFALPTVSGNVLVAAADGSLYVGGLAADTVDFDPGAGTTTRSLPGSDGNQGGFVEQLAADGTFRWVETTDRVPVEAAAATPDSGVIVVGSKFTDGSHSGIFAAKLGATSVPAWSLGLDGTSDLMGLWGVAVSSTSFVLVGGSDADVADVVPGPATVAVPAHSVFLERWDF